MVLQHFWAYYCSWKYQINSKMLGNISLCVVSDSSTTTRWGRTHQFEQQSVLQICRKLHPPYPSVLVTSKIIVWRSLLTVEFFSRACEQQSALLFVRNVANIRFGQEVLRCSSCYHHVQLLKPVHMNYWHVKTECLFLFPVLLLQNHEMSYLQHTIMQFYCWHIDVAPYSPHQSVSHYCYVMTTM